MARLLTLAGLVMAAGMARQAFAGAQPPALRCTPATVHAGQVLTLHLAASHGKELGVRTPAGRFLFLAYQPEGTGSVSPPIASSRFVRLTTVKLPTSSAVGVSLSSGSQPELLFTSSGTYRFVVSENLETEDEAAANHWCAVHFTSRTGP